VRLSGADRAHPKYRQRSRHRRFPLEAFGARAQHNRRHDTPTQYRASARLDFRDRIGQGLGWATIKGFLRTKPEMLNQVRFISRSNCSSSWVLSCQLDQECLSAGPSNITQLPEAFRVKYDDVYNQFRKVIQNQARLATEGRESLLEWAKLLESNRWGVLQRECSSGEQLFACVSPFQQQVGVILSQLECLSLPLPAF
jgi:hypothetical protein